MAWKGKQKAARRRPLDEDEDEYRRQASLYITNILDARQQKKQRIAEHPDLNLPEDEDDEGVDDDEEFNYDDIEDEELEDEAMAEIVQLREDAQDLSRQLDEALAFIKQHGWDGAPNSMTTTPTTTALAATNQAATSASGTHATTTANTENTPRYPVPERLTEVKTRDVREKVGMENNQVRWLQLRTKCRDTSVKGGLKITEPWSHQPLDKLVLILDSVRDTFPELGRFENNWGAHYLVQDAFNHRRQHWLSQQPGYKTCPAKGRKSKRGAPPEPPVEPPDVPQAGPSNSDPQPGPNNEPPQNEPRRLTLDNFFSPRSNTTSSRTVGSESTHDANMNEPRTNVHATTSKTPRSRRTKKSAANIKGDGSVPRATGPTLRPRLRKA